MTSPAANEPEADPLVMLIDGSNLLMRCIKAMEYKGLRSDEDWQTGPLTAFIGALSRFVRDHQPRAVVVCWDGGACERRLNLHPGYKAKRKTPEPAEVERKETAFGMAKTFLRLAGVQQVAVSGYEADDVIAAYWRQCRGLPVMIVSGDKDFFQLLDDRVTQLRPDGGGGYQIWDTEEVRAKYGCGPERLPYLMALTGDPVDGIPGVRGIGPKKALKCLQEAGWDFPTVLEGLGSPQAQDAALSLQLVSLRFVQQYPPVPPVDPFRPVSYGDAERMVELVVFLRSLGMEVTLQRIHTGSLWQ